MPDFGLLSDTFLEPDEMKEAQPPPSHQKPSGSMMKSSQSYLSNSNSQKPNGSMFGGSR